MGSWLYVVVYIKEKQWLGNGIIYIGDSKQTAEKIHSENKDTILYVFDIKDNTIWDFSWKIKPRRLEGEQSTKKEVAWHLKKRGKKR